MSDCPVSSSSLLAPPIVVQSAGDTAVSDSTVSSCHLAPPTVVQSAGDTAVSDNKAIYMSSL